MEDGLRIGGMYITQGVYMLTAIASFVIAFIFIVVKVTAKETVKRITKW